MITIGYFYGEWLKKPCSLDKFTVRSVWKPVCESHPAYICKPQQINSKRN